MKEGERPSKAVKGDELKAACEFFVLDSGSKSGEVFWYGNGKVSDEIIEFFKVWLLVVKDACFSFV